MPNWITNNVEITARQKVIDQIRHDCFDENDNFYFSGICPIPNGLLNVQAPPNFPAIAIAVKHMSEEEKENVFNHISDKFKQTISNMSDELEQKLEADFAEWVKKDFVVEQYDYLGKGIDTLEKLGKQYLDNYFNTGCLEWYDWCLKNWGTKWNPDDTYLDKCNGGILKMTICTAWSSPMAFFEKLVNKYDIHSINVKYADENVGYNCGEYAFSKEEGYTQWNPEEGSDEAVKFACEILGYDESEFIDENDELLGRVLYGI